MFKSITYVKYKYGKTSDKFTYYYHLVDGEFECEVSATASMPRATRGEGSAAAVVVITEYHKRNLPIIKNLYLLNNFLIKGWYPYWSFEKLLNYQNKHIDKYFPIPGINFSKDIYTKLLETHKELSVFE